MAKNPVVTGISPKEGPPGTRVTIRGEHLGINSNDISSNANDNIVENLLINLWYFVNSRFKNMRL